jgi:hypothetical protein
MWRSLHTGGVWCKDHGKHALLRAARGGTVSVTILRSGWNPTGNRAKTGGGFRQSFGVEVRLDEARSRRWGIPTLGSTRPMFHNYLRMCSTLRYGPGHDFPLFLGHIRSD